MTEQGETTNRTEQQQAADRRRSVSGRVRQARERLTSQTGTNPAFDRDLILAYARNQTGIALIVPLLAIIIAGMTTVWVQWSEAAVWLAGVLISNGILTYLCRRYEFGDSYRMSPRLWERRFFAAEFLNGVMWATMAFMTVPHGETEPTIFMFAVLIVILAMRTLTASNLPMASLAGTMPITAAIVLRFSLFGEPLYFAMAGLAVGAQIFFIIIARQLHSTVLAMFGLRMEKDALIGELEQATALSDEARRRAEEANLAKSRFLATMSHELRTPLNAILGFSEILKDEILGKHGVPAYKEYSGDIHRSGQHLLELINEILDLSRIEAGRYGLHEEAVSLPGTVQDCHHLLKLRADQRGIVIEEIFEADLPKIWVDERAVRQVVLNLLTNAIKFSPNGSRVILTVGWTSGGGQYLSVKDSGPGIPEEEIPTVLQTFGRGSLAAKNAEEGSGLGLPIVMKLVELHGGRFDFKSKLREGTEAVVIFPRERVMKALPPMDEAEEIAARRRSAAA
jgi:two-component system cell cycle sensor histidine kinase PleC